MYRTITIEDPRGLCDSERRLIKLGDTVRHYVDEDLGEVVELPLYHVVVNWTNEAGPHAHFGDELTIIRRNGKCMDPYCNLDCAT